MRVHLAIFLTICQAFRAARASTPICYLDRRRRTSPYFFPLLGIAGDPPPTPLGYPRTLHNSLVPREPLLCFLLQSDRLSLSRSTFLFASRPSTGSCHLASRRTVPPLSSDSCPSPFCFFPDSELYLGLRLLTFRLAPVLPDTGGSLWLPA